MRLPYNKSEIIHIEAQVINLMVLQHLNFMKYFQKISFQFF